MMRCLISILMVLLPLVVQAEITFARLAQISLAPEILEGRFSQEKYLESLDAVLTSSGAFTYERGKSIRWKILQPIQNELVMTPKAITSKQDDLEVTLLDMGNNPTAAIVGEIFFSVLTADWEKLARHFELTGEIDARQWHAVLVPTEQVVMRLFRRIEITGNDLLQEIVLHEAGGNRTTIRLDNQR